MLERELVDTLLWRRGELVYMRCMTLDGTQDCLDVSVRVFLCGGVCVRVRVRACVCV